MKNVENILVIDIESTCWNEPTNHDSEIIEVGYTVLNEELEIKENDSIYVLPTSVELISPFCTHLTGITKEILLSRGISFKDACDYLADRFKTRHSVWGSWGLYDKRQFERQCGRQELRYPLPYQHLNIKAQFAFKYGKLCGVGEACNLVGIEFEGRPHSGRDDAMNITRILQNII